VESLRKQIGVPLNHDMQVIKLKRLPLICRGIANPQLALLGACMTV
jgi:hypothetical protein